MVTEALERLQENKLQGVEALIASCEPPTAMSPKGDAADVAAFFVEEGLGLRQSSLRLWDFYWTRVVAGKIQDMRQRGEILFSLLERGARILRRGAALARVYADASGNEVARLAEFEKQSESFPIWVKECKARWELVSRPRRALDAKQVAAAQTAYQRGEGESIADIITRLEQGGPLVRCTRRLSF
jgi:hypothetical protein